MQVYVGHAFWVVFSLSLLYIVLLLRLGAFRRDRTRPTVFWGPPADIRTFLSRSTYEQRGQTLLTLVRLVLLVDLVAMAWLTLVQWTAP